MNRAELEAAERHHQQEAQRAREAIRSMEQDALRRQDEQWRAKLPDPPEGTSWYVILGEIQLLAEPGNLESFVAMANKRDNFWVVWDPCDYEDPKTIEGKWAGPVTTARKMLAAYARFVKRHEASSK